MTFILALRIYIWERKMKFALRKYIIRMQVRFIDDFYISNFIKLQISLDIRLNVVH